MTWQADGWNDDMTEAPRDGTLIQVGWKELEDKNMQEWFCMSWGHIQKNPLVGRHAGMWVAPNGAFTWSEADPDGAPTHWRHMPSVSL